MIQTLCWEDFDLHLGGSPLTILKSCTTLNPWETIVSWFYKGIIIPGFLRWCRISSIHRSSDSPSNSMMIFWPGSAACNCEPWATLCVCSFHFSDFPNPLAGHDGTARLACRFCLRLCAFLILSSILHCDLSRFSRLNSQLATLNFLKYWCRVGLGFLHPRKAIFGSEVVSARPPSTAWTSTTWPRRRSRTSSTLQPLGSDRLPMAQTVAPLVLAQLGFFQVPVEPANK